MLSGIVVVGTVVKIVMWGSTMRDDLITENGSARFFFIVLTKRGCAPQLFVGLFTPDSGFLNCFPQIDPLSPCFDLAWVTQGRTFS